MFKKVMYGILVCIVVLLAINWTTVVYGIRQAKGQLSITFNTRPIDSILQDSLIADSIKQKIRLIQEVREFAFDELGLEKSDNYTTYYDQKGQVALWNLSASEAYSLKPKLWSFPFLGSFPYKGFFDLENAKIERDQLKEAGYDTRIRSVGGWSTLGWTTDPILSNMLNREEGNLTELIIHELTHSTLFVKDNIEFNENLASYIGEKGAIIFLNKKYGKNSTAYFDYVLGEEDSQTFRNQMLLATKKLDNLYISIANESDSVKAIQKHIMIDQIIASVDTLHFHDPRYLRIFDSARPNNAYFMSFLRYYSAKDSLEDLYHNRYNSDLNQFIEGMKTYHSK